MHETHAHTEREWKFFVDHFVPTKRNQMKRKQISSMGELQKSKKKVLSIALTDMLGCSTDIKKTK